MGNSGWKLSLLEHEGIYGVSWRKTSYMPQRTMALSVELVEEAHPLGIAEVLIHEASHVTQDTKDYFYNKFNWIDKESSVQEIKDYSKALLETFKAINEQGPESSATGLTDHYRRTMDNLVGPGSTTEKRSTRFSQDALVRASILTDNADTYSAFVMATKIPAKLMTERSRGRWWKFWR